jgi:uncharacterized protein CbrC (UPF0167 family)
MAARPPSSRYHPDPVATGTVVRSDRVCRACGRGTGYIYVGPVWAEEGLDRFLCPGCIVDGTAHRLYDAEFTARGAIGGRGRWARPCPSVIEEIATRTPGFAVRGPVAWWTCCGDAAAYLGRTERGGARFRCLHCGRLFEE